ncbi:hypothetical protein QUG64_03135 [Acinetobacter lwoffii]|uniref:Uncharacterized protein n=1 Tax=Acinetobacter lwoffii NCTC 5866 = CIP 64.10 = NIPH 512 TaxID=981327 RepID=A0ABN0PZY8_ACILW|nr:MULTISPECIES: hypothetical protein [Acinetobacter]ENU16698.1 hypothetical protein F995_02183 [Acinetobacter sp. CIP A162]ESJ96053.1 hypothetical protein P800_00875 [Acinetobacter lwoffii NCTC 5866 = CIP 64.10 = NIPH 512]QXB40433.1 hypothetical protein I6L23_14875 [Acinetobacter lwoffii]SUU30249.1 Uncharacterised protein [Acinetobacter lwoffii]VFQ38495.1 Uncharacterised protein [Acinetobacter lwoffii]
MGERKRHTDAEQNDEKKSSTIMIFEACVDLHNQGQIITRETLQIALPHLTRGQIDDRLSYLVDTNQVNRVERGVYMPVQQHRPARMISKTVLNDGTVKIEIGDDIVLTLTPKEARDFGCLMMSDAMQHSNIEMGRSMNYLTNNIATQVSKLTRSIERIHEEKIQGGLFDESST